MPQDPFSELPHLQGFCHAPAQLPCLHDLCRGLFSKVNPRYSQRPLIYSYTHPWMKRDQRHRHPHKRRRSTRSSEQCQCETQRIKTTCTQTCICMPGCTAPTNLQGQYRKTQGQVQVHMYVHLGTQTCPITLSHTENTHSYRHLLTSTPIYAQTYIQVTQRMDLPYTQSHIQQRCARTFTQPHTDKHPCIYSHTQSHPPTAHGQTQALTVTHRTHTYILSSSHTLTNTPIYY